MRALARFFPEQNPSAGLALAHAFSRSVCKFDANLDDQQVIQAVGLLETLLLSGNKYQMRLAECYGLHFPELRRLCPEGDLYVVLVCCLPDRAAVGPLASF